MRGLSQTTSIIETYGKKKKGMSLFDILKIVGGVIFTLLVIIYGGPVAQTLLL